MELKIVILIIFVSVTNIFASNTYSQTAKVTLDVENKTLEQVMDEIEQQSEFYFIFNQKQIDVGRILNIKVVDKQIAEILPDLFTGTNINYAVLDRKILLTTEAIDDEFAFLQSGPGQQQNFVTGTVTDASTNAPLPGVNIVIKGTTIGTLTDVNGKYTLSVVDPTRSILVFSFIGYETKEVSVAGRSIVNQMLEATLTGLDEVVVIGYGTQRKADLTGSITQVTTEELTASPVFNLESSLKGRASGVFVSENDGTPGASISMRIRGDNSIIGSNEPLYVVDGMPMGGISNLNPSDIQSISILKDASSTAIYGSRAANGVVVITTVRGAKGTAGRIEINSYYGMQNELKRYYSLTAKQYAIASNEWLKNEGQEPYFSPSEIEALGDGTDWWAEFIKPAPIQSHTLNFSGGGENTTYSWSINYFDQVGLMINSGAKRGNTRLNLIHEVNNKVKLGLNAVLGRRIVDQVPFNNAAWHDGILGSPPTLPVKDDNGNYTRVGTVYNWTLGNIPNMGIYSKPFKDKSVNNSVYANTSFEFKITKELIFESRNGLDYNNNFSEEFAPTSDYEGRYYNDEYADGGYASNSQSHSNSFLTENTLSYLKLINKHKIDVIGGVTYQTYNSRSFGISVNKLATDITGNYNLSASSKINNPSSGYSDWAMLSGLARINYSFDSRYLITASIRADGSSRFGANHKWGYFPSGAVAWNLSNESFMADVDFIDNLKLRASYGITGSTALSPYQSLNRLSSQYAVFGGNSNTPGYIPSNVGNPDLKWEKTKQWDIGLDFGILEGVLNLTVDYYWKVTSDLLASVPLPSSTGYSSVLKNIGSIQNKGLEVSLSANVLRRVFKWDIAVQASANRNTILELVGGADIIGATFGHPFEGPLNIMREGEAYGSFYGLVYDGLNEEGYFKYKDINNDGTVNPQDRVIIGNPNAKLLYSINNNLSYKGLALNIFFEGIQGRDIYWATAGTHLGSMLNGHNQLADFHGNYWTTENPNPNAKYQRISTKAYTDVSTKFVEDGSYLKLKSLTLSYNLPVSKISWIEQLQIYTTGSNLISFNNYPGLDPDVNTRGNQIFRGVDQNAYPTARTATIGCKIVF